MNKLVALPVSGESFLLQRGGRNILIDGGHRSQALISALSAPDVAVKHLHVVVCTHADHDHAGGLTDLLDKSPSVRVDEFWLPGAWSDALPELLQSPSQVVNALVDELKKFDSDDADGLDEDDDAFELRVHARIAEQRRKARAERQDSHEAGPPDGEVTLKWLKRQAANADLDPARDIATAKVFARGRRAVRYRAARSQLNRRWSAFWVGLIDTAERIRQIAVQAIRHGVTVRWFDFGEFCQTHHASGGLPGLLIPLNSVELDVPPRPAIALSYAARLTAVNEECLVFLSPGGCWPDDLGVVFTGDSPLGQGRDYAQPLFDWPVEPIPMVVATAPHHGSENNAVAYKHLGAKAFVVLWLRSGGGAKHPGQTFRQLPSQRRACTHCPHLTLSRAAAEVQLSDNGGWPLFRVKAHDCRC